VTRLIEILGSDRLHRGVLGGDEGIGVPFRLFDEAELGGGRVEFLEATHDAIACFRLVDLAPIIIEVLLPAKLDVPARLVGEVVRRVSEVVAELLEDGLPLHRADRLAEAQVREIGQATCGAEEQDHAQHCQARDRLEPH